MRLYSHETPFGPHDQTLIENDEQAIEILTVIEPLTSALNFRWNIVYGRKGSGKTAVLTSYSHYENLFEISKNELKKVVSASSDYVIELKTWNDIRPLLIYVNQKLAATQGASTLDGFVFVEEYELYFNEVFWDRIASHLFELVRKNKIKRGDLPTVCHYFEHDSNSLQITKLGEDESKIKIKEEINHHLARVNKKLLIVIDSWDEYPLRNEGFKTLLKGLLRSAARFKKESDHVRIICAIPEEIFHYVRDHATNILKDLELTYPLRWKPIDLIEITARRYIGYHKLHDKDHLTNISKHLNLESREQKIELMTSFLPANVTNGLGVAENTMAYIIRHTFLLPRHIIMYFNSIARLNWTQNKTLRKFDAKCVTDGIRQSEMKIAEDVLSLYAIMYDDLAIVLQETLDDCPPVFDFGSLDKLLSRIERNRYGLNRFQWWKMLYRIGIIGQVVDDEVLRNKHRGMYTYARFHFCDDDEDNSSFPTEATYCLHPVFSRVYRATDRRNGDQRLIYPARVEID